MSRGYDGCTGKVSFTSFTRAARVASRQSKRHHRRFQPYACEHCGAFHVGSSIGAADVRKMRIGAHRPFAVYASLAGGAEVLVGWSNTPDGADVEKIITNEAGWRITRVVGPRRRAA